MIHQIFLKVRGKEFTSNDIFVKSSLAWQDFCKKNDMGYRLWTDDNIYGLRSAYQEIFDKLDEEGRDPFVKVDYLRPVVLDIFGGCYVDLDIFPNDNFKELYDSNDIIIGSWTNPKNNKRYLNNNVLKLDGDIAKEVINHYKTQIYEKSQIKVYDTWKLRYIMQTCGPKSLARYCKSKKITYTPNLDNYITDYTTATWLD